jgi:hypothetical protein
LRSQTQSGAAFLILAAVFLLFAGCGKPEKPAAEAEKAPTPAGPPAPPKEVTGREAFQNMFVAARSWVPDAKPFRLTNFQLKLSTGIGGHAAAWTASFASASLRKYKTYTYSTVKTENLHEGVFAGHDETYSSTSELTAPPFEVVALKTDTDKVFEAAEAKGGKGYREKHPNTPVTFLLEYARTYQRLVWHVCYDSSCSTSPFTVQVDAATGAVLKVSK